MSGTGAPLRHIANRWEPEPGSKRSRRMMTVTAYLLAHPGGGTYVDIGRALNLPSNAVQNAVYDIRRFHPELVVAVPTVRSGWRASLRWRDVMHGAVAEAKQIMTRLQSQAVLQRKMAASGKFTPAVAQMFRAAAAQSDAQAAQQEAMIAVYEAARPQAQTGHSGS